MATIDGGFIVGDTVVPDSSYIWAKTQKPCTVVYEDGRYTMQIKLPDNSLVFVHPYGYKKIGVIL